MIEKSRFDTLVNELENANKVIAKLQFQLDQFIRAVHGAKSEKLRLLTVSQSAASPELPFGEDLKEEVEPET